MGEKIKLFDLLMPEEREQRKEVIKRVLPLLTRLRNWFTMDNNHLLRSRLIIFLETLPFIAFNDLQFEDLSLIDEEGTKKVNEKYELWIGKNIFSRDILLDDFNIDVTVLFMI